ncbi:MULTISPECIES: ABC transporter permease [Collinsella]|uniref:Glutathione transport system permease protein GsiC n=1 Tax=Collinsella ihumii TaxID=1720204 RepID=A0ABT7XEP8_9ACTN|nr:MULTISPECIES: ABC transporter permease [Collinsella]MBM6777504.1 ABC transporter permease [Collinsella tanakaei]MBM6905331.1 ABC transporter permease [Collinsella tanakaei]MDN0063662.1 ABC transporter permease [Collinsella ihumii]OUO61795.1 glutathione ABC transporter permease GsiC [Collinsella sp. An271]
MGKYAVKRVLSMIPLLIVISIIIFMFVRLIPGDPARQIGGPTATIGEIENIRRELGLDQPLVPQYLQWITGIFQGDLGHSFTNNTSVAELLAPRLPITIYLTICSITWSVIIGIIIGVIAAINRGRALDLLGMLIAIAGISLPNFWLGLQLMQIFSVNLGIFPTGGLEDWRGYVLPSIAMGAGIMAILARVTRSSMIENLGKDYIRTARAKGLPEPRVIMVHAFKNSSIDIITVTALQIGALIAGSVVVESVFSIPGMGRLLVDSIGFRDYEVVQALILFFSFEYMVINLLADILYAVINPRVRYE